MSSSIHGNSPEDQEETPKWNTFLEGELTDAIKRHTYKKAEKNSEMRHLVAGLQRDAHDKSRIAESLNVLPLSDIKKLFADYIEEQFDVHLHTFFSRLIKGVMHVMRDTISARIEVMEDTMVDLKQSVLMASLHPYAWVESEVAKNAVEFIGAQPGQKSGLHDIYTYLAQEVGLPLPGAGLVDKQMYILKLLRRIPNLREWDGMLFELVQHDVLEERETFATSQEYQESVMQPALKLAKRRLKVRRT